MVQGTLNRPQSDFPNVKSASINPKPPYKPPMHASPYVIPKALEMDHTIDNCPGIYITSLPQEPEPKKFKLQYKDQIRKA